MNGFRRFAILPAFLAVAAFPVFSAEPRTQPAEDEVLDEVLVSGQKPEKSGQKVIEWMARLVGQFTFEGHVDLHGKGKSEDLLPVSGGSSCIGFGPAPAVQCEFRVRWPEVRGENGEELPGAVPNLDPAIILYGFEADRFGVRYMLVDNKGIAEGALGLIYGDTLVSKAACVNIPGNCQKVVRITAAPDLKAVLMNIEIEIDYARALTYSFAMNRVPGSRSVVVPGNR